MLRPNLYLKSPPPPFHSNDLKANSCPESDGEILSRLRQESARVPFPSIESCGKRRIGKFRISWPQLKIRTANLSCRSHFIFVIIVISLLFYMVYFDYKTRMTPENRKARLVSQRQIIYFRPITLPLKVTLNISHKNRLDQLKTIDYP